jgi:hypothetical protein
MAIIVPRFHDISKYTVLTHGLSYFVDVICFTGQQRSIFLLMSILGVITCDVANRANKLIFVLVFPVVSRSARITGRKFYSL